MTILTALKPFVGRVAEVQACALANWKLRFPDAEIVDVQGEAGPPDFADIVRRAADGAGDVLVYANADILFPPAAADVARWCEAQADDFLVVGRRTDELEGGQREPHRPSGMDYFFFRKGMFSDLPETRMGRAYCDSALLAHCLRCGIRVVDASDVLDVVHQFHVYGHVAGGRDEVFAGADAMANKRNNRLRDFGPHLADVGERFVWKGGSLAVVRKPVCPLRRLGLWGLWNRLFRGGLGFWGIHRYGGANGACYLTRSKVEAWSTNSNVRQRFRQVVDAPRGVWTGFDFPCMWMGWRISRRLRIPWTLFLWDPPSLGHRDRFSPLRRAIDIAFRWFARRCDKLVLNIHPGILDEIGFRRDEIDGWRRSGKLELRMQDAFEGLEPAPIVDLPRYDFDIGILSRETKAKGKDLVAAALKKLPGATCAWVHDLPQEEAFARLRKCRVLLVPYLPVPSLKWNYPLKLFEYLSLGRPILASDNPGNAAVAERFPGRIRLFRSGDADDLAEKCAAECYMGKDEISMI